MFIPQDTLALGGSATDDTAATDVQGGSDGGDSLWSGLGGLFASLGTTIATDYRAIAGPTTVKPGTVIYDPNTGRTSMAGQLGLPTGTGGMLMLLGIALLVVLLFMRTR